MDRTKSHYTQVYFCSMDQELSETWLLEVIL